MLCFSLEQLGEHAKAKVLLQELGEIRSHHYDSLQHPLVIANHLRLANVYEAIGDTEAMNAALLKANVDSIGDLEFKSRTPIEKTDLHFSELDLLGWEATDIALINDGNSELLEIRFQKAATRGKCFIRRFRESDVEVHKARLRREGFELKDSAAYEVRGEKSVVTLWKTIGR